MDYQNFIQITNQTLNEDFSQKPYLLLDCSQLKKMQRTAMLGYGGIPLWRNVLKMEDETVSPVLLELDKRDFACQIKQICEKMQDIPLYSIILSPLEAKELAEHLGQYSLCQTQDGQPLILRFGDTRILPVLENTFSNEHRIHFFAPITKWFYPDIGSEWRLIENQNAAAVSKLKGILELNDAEYEGIMNGSRPYTLFVKVYEHLMQSGNTNENIRSDLWMDIRVEVEKEDIASPSFSMNRFIGRYLQSLPDKLEIWKSDETTLPGRFEYQEAV